MANKQPPIFSLLIINKAGGLIYQKTYAGANSNLNARESDLTRFLHRGSVATISE
jgi:hypothetical protein